MLCARLALSSDMHFMTKLFNSSGNSLLISIGRDVTISQYAHLCAGTHDYRRSDMPLLKTPIRIGEGVWICADSFIGPGVNVGSFAVVAARVLVPVPGPARIRGACCDHGRGFLSANRQRTSLCHIPSAGRSWSGRNTK